MKILNRRKLFERVRREVQIGGSGGAGSRGQILRFGRRPDSDGFAIKSMIKTGPFWSPEGSGAIWAVSGAVQKGAGTGRFQDVRTEEFHRRSDVHTLSLLRAIAS